MPVDDPRERRRFPTKWSVTAFVVLVLAIWVAIMLWQSRGERPEQTDSGLGSPAPSAPARAGDH